MIPAAMTHINTAMTTIDWMPPATGRLRSLTTSSLVSAVSPSGAGVVPSTGDRHREGLALEHDLLGVLERQEHGREPEVVPAFRGLADHAERLPPDHQASPTPWEISRTDDGLTRPSSPVLR